MENIWNEFEEVVIRADRWKYVNNLTMTLEKVIKKEGNMTQLYDLTKKLEEKYSRSQWSVRNNQRKPLNEDHMQ